MNKKRGFTLAEVLITLAIVGIVAALTIPNLIVEHQKKQTVTRLEKIYSELNNGVMRSVVDNDFPENWVHDKNMFDTYIKPYLILAKDCSSDGIFPNDCVATAKMYMNGHILNISDDRSMVLLPNGVQVIYNYVAEDSPYHNFLVDINGDKKPNKMGKDLFLMRMYVEKHSNPNFLHREGWIEFLYPYLRRSTMLDDSQWGCNKNATPGPGLYCGALIKIDGWQIKEDYPW